MQTSRRDIIKASAATLGVFAVGFYIPLDGMPKLLAQAPETKQMPLPSPNAFISIAADDSITITINKLEMGQGVNTSMAQLIAEELACDWTKIRSVSAPVNPVYNHTAMPVQMTGGSTSLASSWTQYRTLGAAMREMLVSAAAQRWGVPVASCTAANGVVSHPSKGKLTYGALAAEAAQQAMPAEPKLKDSKDFTIIGKSKKRVDALEKTVGKAQFGLDIRIPNMVYAMVAHGPVVGAKITSLDDKATRAMKGVVDVVRFGEKVGVLATNTHIARKGRDALKITWNPDQADLSTAGMVKQFRKELDSPGALAEKRGEVDQAMKGSSKTLELEYALPFLAHASMEPLNITVNYDGKSCEIWSGHQMPGIDATVTAKILGLDPSLVKVNTTYAGGSFGRRASKDSDYVRVAVELAKQVKRPLQLVYTREDDMRAGYYRPMAIHSVKIGIKGKELAGWDHKIVCQSIFKGTLFESSIKNGVEEAAVEGVAKTHYDLKQFRCTQTLAQTPLTTLWWRSVGHTHTAFAMESAMDELAEGMQTDPMKLRKTLLKNSPRHMAVLELLEKESGWSRLKAKANRAYGLAIHESFNSVVGYVTEVSMEGKLPKVHKVWAAVHCGQVVNPEVAKTQIEGSIVFGLSALLYQEIIVERGQIKTGNYDDFPVMRMNEMPEVKVAFVPSKDPPSGLGEPGVPPIAPAVANAYYVLTKQRLRSLPIGSKSYTV